METASPGDGLGGLTPKRLLSREDCISARRGASRGAERLGGPVRAVPFPGPVVLAETKTREGDVLGVGIDWAEEFHLVALGRRRRGVIEVLPGRASPGRGSAADRADRRPGAGPGRGAGGDRDPPRPAGRGAGGRRVHGGAGQPGPGRPPARPGAEEGRRRGRPDRLPAGPGPVRPAPAAGPPRRHRRGAAGHRPRRRAGLPRRTPAAQPAARRPARHLPRRAGHRRGRPGRPHGSCACWNAGPPPRRWPPPAATSSSASPARSAHGWPDRFADRVAAALAEDHFTAPRLPGPGQGRHHPPHRHANCSWSARNAAPGNDAWANCCSAPHARPAPQPEDQPGPAFPGGEIYLSFPGLGDRLAARVAGEIGDHIEQFATPNSLQCYAGNAPVTRRSGKSELVVSNRLACNRHLANAVQQWAFCRLHHSRWARHFYDTQRARGKTHHAALRALGNRWLDVLWHCLTQGVHYDEHTHTANRDRALATVTAPAA